MFLACVIASIFAAALDGGPDHRLGIVFSQFCA